MINFCILLDKNNDWILPYASEFLEESNFEPSRYIIFSPKEADGFQICFVLGYTAIIPEEELPVTCNFFVIHESPLPKGKGFSPLFWQIIEGNNDIDVCLIELSSEVDSGRIILMDQISLDGFELHDEIRKKQSEISFKLITEFINNYPNLTYRDQVGKSTFYKRRSPLDSKLDIDKSIKSQFNLMRTCNNNNYPAFIELSGKKYKISIEKYDEKNYQYLGKTDWE